MRTRLVVVVSVLALACSKPEPLIARSSPPEVERDAEPPASESPASVREAGTDAGVEPTGRTLFVRETQVDCEGEGPQRCLQVRESEDAEWTLFYGKIEGFTYEPGHAYVLRVATKDRSAPPADSPSRKLRLVEVLSKVP